MGNKEPVNRLDDESRSKVVARLQARRTDILVSEPSRLPDVPKCGNSPGRAPLSGGDEGPYVEPVPDADVRRALAELIAP